MLKSGHVVYTAIFSGVLITSAILVRHSEDVAQEQMSDLGNSGGPIFQENCIPCHRGSAAPDLLGIKGRPAGVTYFTYSNAFRGIELVWEEDTLDAFIRDPQAMVPGNRMAFYGIEDDEERAAVVAYMLQRSSQ